MIVVLDIIALIAVPIVLNIIEKSRQGAAISSARNYIKAVETYVVSSELDKNKLKLDKNNKYNVTKDTMIESKNYLKTNDLVSLEGSFPTGSDDYVILGETKQVIETLLTINGYEILIKDDEVITIVKGKKIAVESSSLNKIKETMERGSTLQLVATITPNNATDKAITWSTSNANIASVDSNGLVMAKGLGNATISATTGNGKTATTNITVNMAILSEVVNVGDYVAYDAGTWTSSANLPTSQGQFGGYKVGYNKAVSVGCSGSSPIYSGWRVLKIENNQVYLVHAGQPECYYHTNNPASNIITLNNRAANEYLNSRYADSAHMMTKDEAMAITGSIDSTSNTLRAIGTQYGLANLYDNVFLWCVNDAGEMSFINGLYAVRPVVVLKSTIKTTGKTTDAVGQVAWSLVTP